jgi:hypothetical protein
MDKLHFSLHLSTKSAISVDAFHYSRHGSRPGRFRSASLHFIPPKVYFVIASR